MILNTEESDNHPRQARRSFLYIYFQCVIKTSKNISNSKFLRTSGLQTNHKIAGKSNKIGEDTSLINRYQMKFALFEKKTSYLRLE